MVDLGPAVKADRPELGLGWKELGCSSQARSGILQASCLTKGPREQATVEGPESSMSFSRDLFVGVGPGCVFEKYLILPHHPISLTKSNLSQETWKLNIFFKTMV